MPRRTGNERLRSTRPSTPLHEDAFSNFPYKLVTVPDPSAAPTATTKWATGQAGRRRQRRLYSEGHRELPRKATRADPRGRNGPPGPVGQAQPLQRKSRTTWSRRSRSTRKSSPSSPEPGNYLASSSSTPAATTTPRRSEQGERGEAQRSVGAGGQGGLLQPPGGLPQATPLETGGRASSRTTPKVTTAWPSSTGTRPAATSGCRPPKRRTSSRRGSTWKTRRSGSTRTTWKPMTYKNILLRLQANVARRTPPEAEGSARRGRQAPQARSSTRRTASRREGLVP